MIIGGVQIAVIWALPGVARLPERQCARLDRDPQMAGPHIRAPLYRVNAARPSE